MDDLSIIEGFPLSGPATLKRDPILTGTGSGTRSVTRPQQWQPQRLKPHHRTIARMLLMGYTQKEITETIELTPLQVSNIVNSDLFQAELARLESSADDQAVDNAKDLNLMTSRCMEILSRDLDEDKPSKAQTKTAFDILDRTGFHKAADKPSETNINILNIAPSPGDDAATHVAAIEVFKLQARKEAEEELANRLIEEESYVK